MSAPTFRDLYEYCELADRDRYGIHVPDPSNNFRIQLFDGLDQIDIGDVQNHMFVPRFTVMFGRINVTGEVGVCKVVDGVPDYGAIEYAPDTTPVTKLNFPKLQAALVKTLSAPVKHGTLIGLED